MTSEGVPEKYTGARKKEKPIKKEKKRHSDSPRGEKVKQIEPVVNRNHTGSAQNMKQPESKEWLTQEDVERDMWIYSEFFQDPQFEAAPPKTILEWWNRKGQNDTKSIFDQEVPEEHEIFISGRGRGVPHKLVRPGEPVYATKSDTDEIVKKIREISGLGYRNEVIEQEFANKAFNDAISDNQFVDYETFPELCGYPQYNSTSEPSSSTHTVISGETCSVKSSPAGSCHSGEYKSPPRSEVLDIDSSHDFPPLN